MRARPARRVHFLFLFNDLRLKPVDGRELRTLPGEALDRAHQAALSRVHQGHGNPRAPGAAGTADAVHIVFCLARRVEIDHVADASHIDAACSHIGGDQDAGAAVTQAFERAIALALIHIAMQGVRSKAVVTQQTRQIIRAAFGRGEHQRLLNVGIAQDRVEQLVFVRHVVGKHEALFDVGFRFGGRGDLDAFGITRDFARHCTDHAVERCREQQGLARRRSLGDNRFDVLDEAHVKHPVGFVEDQHFETAKIDAATLHVIHQTARRGNHNINRTLQRFQLHRVGHATDQTGNTKLLELVTVVERGLVDLQRKFARWRQHQNARAVALDRRVNRETVQAWQHESCGLAAAGIGRHQQISAGQGSRDRFNLNRCRLLIARFFERIENDRVQTQIRKSSGIRHDTKPFVSLDCSSDKAIATRAKTAQEKVANWAQPGLNSNLP